ncbi:hypothetical protein Csp2054_14185 [Curtobacterium sp. 'Ferrero']|uniref:hypothetical protein n=1 Tax=Curtobacterium sp. 'Ferrero' TaxID=2033654 RepID=UPI000BD38187|nr:hypothetical protein [Curtobacterium sp. 'Ferrero']PCN46988.1 hypothetical protein Csp2054_14185 [Curtobacterium sp. 'Ferrero']
MPWFKVDDNLAFHPKVLAAGNAAMGLWVRAGSWAAQQLTDGVIPDSILPSLGTRKQADALVAAGLWTRADGAWRFHEWNADGRQPTRARVEADRAAATERQRKHREARGSSQRDKGVTDGVSHGSVTGGVTPTPTRPDPTRPPSPDGEGKTVPRKRGTRLERSWQPSAETVDRMRAEAPGIDLRREHEVFVDYWTSKTGQAATKADWDATWRNWMRRKADDVAKRDQPRSTAAQRNLSVVERFAAREQQEQYPSALEGM